MTEYKSPEEYEAELAGIYGKEQVEEAKKVLESDNYRKQAVVVA